MSYYISPDYCINCGACVGDCPYNAIEEGSSSYVIDDGLCVSCGACQPTCPVEAIWPQYWESSPPSASAVKMLDQVTGPAIPIKNLEYGCLIYNTSGGIICDGFTRNVRVSEVIENIVVYQWSNRQRHYLQIPLTIEPKLIINMRFSALTSTDYARFTGANYEIFLENGLYTYFEIWQEWIDSTKDTYPSVDPSADITILACG